MTAMCGENSANKASVPDSLNETLDEELAAVGAVEPTYDGPDE
jgi:hypothetical protein